MPSVKPTHVAQPLLPGPQGDMAAIRLPSISTHSCETQHVRCVVTDSNGSTHQRGPWQLTLGPGEASALPLPLAGT